MFKRQSTCRFFIVRRLSPRLSPLECALPRSVGFCTVSVQISLLESALTHARPVSPLECAVTKKGGRGTPRESGENSKIEAIAQDHFRNQMVRSARQSHSQPKVHFPLWRKVQVDHRENLMLLLADRRKIRRRA